MKHSPGRNRKILVALDASEASSHARHYVVDMFANTEALEVRLFQVLPPIPPEYREHGGSVDPDEEGALSEALRKAQHQWIDEAKAKPHAFMGNDKAILVDGGTTADRISVAFTPSVVPSEIVRDILQAATEWQCGTIIVGRQCCSKFAEVFHHHIGEDWRTRVRDLPSGSLNDSIGAPTKRLRVAARRAADAVIFEQGLAKEGQALQAQVAGLSGVVTPS